MIPPRTISLPADHPLLRGLRSPAANFFIAMGFIACAACSRNSTSDAKPEVIAPPVEAVQARLGSLPLVQRLSGTVLAENQVVLFAETDGRVIAVHVQNGANVKRGDALLELQDDSLREQVRQAEAGHRINEARVRQAEASLAELAAQVRRTKELGKQALVTELELETASAQLASAHADVDLAKAQLDQSAATLAERRNLFGKLTVRSPIDGVVGQRNAEVGMQVTPSTALFTVGNLERVRVRVQIADRMLGFLQAGQPARIFPGGSDRANEVPLNARLTRISPFLNEVSRSTEAEIEVDNPDHLLRPGMFVPVDIAYGESASATLIPASGLFSDSDTGRTGVFVLSAAPTAGGADAPPLPPLPPLPSPVPPGETGAADDASQTPLTAPRPLEFRTARIVARGAMVVAVESVQPGDWVVTLGQDLLSTQGQLGRVRPVSWDHVLELQGIKREDLLNDLLHPGAVR